MRLMKRSSRLFFVFLVSHIIIFIIPLLLGGIVYINAEKLVYKQVIRFNEAMLEQVRQEIDLRLNEVRKLADQIALNKRIQKFMHVTAPVSARDRYDLIDIIGDLSSYKNITPFIDDFYVYFSNSDVLLTPTAHFMSDLFYDTLYNYGGVSYKVWHDNILTKYYPGNFMPVKMKALNYNPVQMIVYMQSLSYMENGRSYANVAILIDEQKIAGILSNIKELSKGAVYVVGSDNRIITAASKIDIIKQPFYEELEYMDTYSYKAVAGKNIVISSISSQQSDWKYVSVLPMHIFLEKVNYLRSLTYWITILCLVVGLLIAYLLAYKNYNPIKRVVKSIHSYAGDIRISSRNELNFIEEAVAAIIDKREEINDRLKHYWLVLKVNLLTKLVKGKINYGDDIFKSLDVHDIKFPYKRFVVVLFYIDDYGEMIHSDMSQERQLAKFIITNVVEELANQHGTGYMVELEDDILTLILNVEDHMEIYQVKKMVEEAREFIMKHYQVFFTVGIGRIYAGIEHIHLSYQEAVKALDYRIIHGNSSTISYDQVLDGAGNGNINYYYTVNMETELINYVKVGNIKEAKALLDKILIENFMKRNLPFRILQCLFFDIMSTAIKTLDEISVDYKEIFGESFNPVNKLLQCSTIVEIHNEIEKIYERICQYISHHKKSHNEVLKNKILEFLEEHYFDQNFSQATMAEQLGISSSYLSFFFKEQFGEKMVDYIGKLRVEKAKMMLLDDKLTVNEIACKVGCSNDMSLIRIFKKYEGATPGEYRRTLHRQY